jgi:hypothetical protein
MTPQLTFGASPIKMLNGQPPDAAKAVTAARLQFDLANGQTWVLYIVTDGISGSLNYLTNGSAAACQA